MKPSICPFYPCCHFSDPWFSSYLYSACASPWNQSSSLTVQSNQSSSSVAQTYLYLFAGCFFGKVISPQWKWTFWDVWCSRGKALDHNASHLWAKVVHTSPCIVPIVSYHENNRRLHLIVPTDRIMHEIHMYNNRAQLHYNRRNWYAACASKIKSQEGFL